MEQNSQFKPFFSIFQTLPFHISGSITGATFSIQDIQHQWYNGHHLVTQALYYAVDCLHYFVMCWATSYIACSKFLRTLNFMPRKQGLKCHKQTRQ
jgi:hypothetical protein